MWKNTKTEKAYDFNAKLQLLGEGLRGEQKVAHDNRNNHNEDTII